MQAALCHSGRCAQHKHTAHGAESAHSAIDINRLVLGEHQSQTKGCCSGECKRHTRTYDGPLRLRAQARCCAEHVQGHGQAQQHHRHGAQHDGLWAMPVHQTRPQRGPQGIGVEGQQRQGHRQARDRRIQTQALHAHQQTDGQQGALVLGGEANVHLLLPKQQRHHQRCDTAAHRDRSGYIDTVLKRKTCSHMVRSHHQGDEQQSGEGGERK